MKLVRAWLSKPIHLSKTKTYLLVTNRLYFGYSCKNTSSSSPMTTLNNNHRVYTISLVAIAYITADVTRRTHCLGLLHDRT